MDHSRFAKMIDVNLWGPTLWAGPAMVCVGEAARRHGHQYIVVGRAYPSSRPGRLQRDQGRVDQPTKHLALELATKARVNAVAPRVVRTRLAKALWRESEHELAARFPLGRIGQPRDVPGAVAFLAGDPASWMTGEAIVIDGGQMLGAPANATLTEAAH
jgi:NAD(P)-dependent dehydrogenase (short-subunit alcohol dehydrogenase family)